MAIWHRKNGTTIDGYHVGGKDQFTAWAQVVNYNKEAAKVHVFYDLEWVPGLQG
jgi:hypothetical protein